MQKFENYLKKEIKDLDETQKISNLLEVVVFCLNNLPDMEKIELRSIQKVINQLGSMVKYYNQISLELLEKDEAEMNNSISQNINLKSELETSIAELRHKLELEQSGLEELNELKEILTTIDNLLNRLSLDQGVFATLHNQKKYFNKLGAGYESLEEDLKECQTLIDKLELNLNSLVEDKQNVERKLREVINEI